MSLASSSAPMTNGTDVLVDLGEALKEYPASLLDHLDGWSERAGSRHFLRERRHDDTWDALTYVEAKAWVDAVGQELVDRGVLPGTHLLILDRNSFAHAVVSLAAMRIGAIATPVSAAYPETEFGRARLSRIIGMLPPSTVIYAGRHGSGAQISTACLPPARTITEADVRGRRIGAGRVNAVPAADWRTADPERIAKLMFTSGSTGRPKAVPHTHRMLCAQQQQMAQAWPFLEAHPPVLCDWLPWHHTSGGNNSFNMTLRNGGTLYIDDGSPTAQGLARSCRNLMDARPTWYTNVPLAYLSLAKVMQADPLLARAFFSRIDMLVYGGAPLAADVWSALSSLHERATGRAAPWGSGWGLTETTSTSAVTRQPSSACGFIGLPLPGLTILLKPSGKHFRAFVKGPNVFPGYWEQGGLVRDATMVDGYFDTGDLLDLRDRESPELGLSYVGRASEIFKVNTGVWVVPSLVKGSLIQELGEVCKEVVPFADSHGQLVAAVWLHDTAAGTDEGESQWSSLEGGLQRYNALRPHSSEHVKALVVLGRSPDGGSGELTDKGSINRAQLIANRRLSSFDVETLPDHVKVVPEAHILALTQ
jgi:feruloyl-CoA synthase